MIRCPIIYRSVVTDDASDTRPAWAALAYVLPEEHPIPDAELLAIEDRILDEVRAAGLGAILAWHPGVCPALTLTVGNPSDATTWHPLITLWEAPAPAAT